MRFCGSMSWVACVLRAVQNATQTPLLYTSVYFFVQLLDIYDWSRDHGSYKGYEYTSGKNSTFLKELAIYINLCAFVGTFIIQDFFPVAPRPNSGSWSPLSGLRDHIHWTHLLGRTPLHEWSERRRDFFLTIQNTHKGRTWTSPAEFEPAIPASERPQTNTLGGADTGDRHITSPNF